MGMLPIPEFGKVYIVDGYPDDNFPEMLTLEEFGPKCLYLETSFEPLVPTEKIAEDLENVDIEHDIRSLSETIHHLLEQFRPKDNG